MRAIKLIYFYLEEDKSLHSFLQLYSWCLVAVIILWLFLTVPWVGLQCVIVVFLDHTSLLLWWICQDLCNVTLYIRSRVVMGGTLGTGTFKPEKNLVFFRIKSPGPHRCHPGKLE